MEVTKCINMFSKGELVDQIKKIKCVSCNRSEYLRYGRHTYFFLIMFFSGKKYFMHLKGISPFKMHKVIFFPENLEKILGFTS